MMRTGHILIGIFAWLIIGCSTSPDTAAHSTMPPGEAEPASVASGATAAAIAESHDRTARPARYTVPNIPDCLEDLSPECWLLTRLVIEDEESGGLDPAECCIGLLIPVTSEPVDADWVFAHGLFYSSMQDLRLLLRDAVADAPIISVDVHERLADRLHLLADYGPEVPQKAAADARYRTDLAGYAPKGLFIARLGGQSQTQAALLFPQSNMYRSMAMHLMGSVYVRDVEELRCALSLVAAGQSQPGTVYVYEWILATLSDAALEPDDDYDLLVPLDPAGAMAKAIMPDQE